MMINTFWANFPPYRSWSPVKPTRGHRHSTNVFRRQSNLELRRCKSGKSHSSGDLLTRGLAGLSGKCRKPRHWVTLDDGSGWFQTVGRELCRRGQYGVCILSWGSRDSLRQDLSVLFSYGGKGGIGGWVCESDDVWNYIVQMYLNIQLQLKE